MKIYTSLVRSVNTYGAEVWNMGVRNRDRLLATEMDFLKRSCGLTRTNRVRNEKIRRRIEHGRGSYASSINNYYYFPIS